MGIRLTLNNRIPERAARYRAEVERIVYESAIEIVLVARQLAPSDTGFLSEHIFGRPTADPLKFLVIATAHYAGYVEYGTEISDSQPFFYPAYLLVRPRMIARLKALKF